MECEILSLYYYLIKLTCLQISSIVFLVEDHFVLFKEVSSFCIDGYDQRSEFF